MAGDGSAPPKFARGRTGFLLQWAYRRARGATNDAMAPLGIDVRHFGLLLALSQLGPCTQRELIDALDVDRSSMVLLVDTLERAKLVERQRVARDRRAHAVHLTATGRTRLEDALATAARVEASLLAPLDADERRVLNDLLWRLIRHSTAVSKS